MSSGGSTLPRPADAVRSLTIWCGPELPRTSVNPMSVTKITLRIVVACSRSNHRTAASPATTARNRAVTTIEGHGGKLTWMSMNRAIKPCEHHRPHELTREADHHCQQCRHCQGGHQDQQDFRREIASSRGS